MTYGKNIEVKHSYKSNPVEIVSIKDLTEDTRYFKVRCMSEEMKAQFNYKPGQFVQFSIHGLGEATFSISSPPTRRDFVEFGIRKVGSFTEALFKLKEGDTFEMRGPYGNGFDMESLKGRDLIIIAGGLGAVPLRSALLYAGGSSRVSRQCTLLPSTASCSGGPCCASLPCSCRPWSATLPGLLYRSRCCPPRTAH